jgi:hypothetical protein
MEKQYGLIADRQTFVARLQTLINLVDAVHKGKATSPEFQSLSDPCTHYGMVGKHWKASADRDNRGKVYLYFCPEDMTVALNNVQGIGWQGVPYEMEGHGLVMRDVPVIDNEHLEAPEITVRVPGVGKVTRQPLKELGAGFFQRVFTAKQRPDASGKIGDVLIGHRSPHEFALRKKGEDDHAHVAAGSATLRTKKRSTTPVFAASPAIHYPIRSRPTCGLAGGRSRANPRGHMRKSIRSIRPQLSRAIMVCLKNGYSSRIPKMRLYPAARMT